MHTYVVDVNIVSHTHQELKIATNVANLALGWPLGEYGKPRDTPLPWPPDLNALGSDADLTATINKIMDDTLNLNSASDVNAKSFVSVSRSVCLCA